MGKWKSPGSEELKHFVNANNKFKGHETKLQTYEIIMHI